MSQSVSRYADRYSKKSRVSSEDRKALLKDKENYASYLENNQEQRLQQIETALSEHEEKFDNIVKLIKLLQNFAESQESENQNIHQMVSNQFDSLYSGEICLMRKALDNQNEKYNQCISELQNAYQDADRMHLDFEQRTADFISKMQEDLLNEIRNLQGQMTSPRTDFDQLQSNLNKKLEVIMGEIRQSALKQDVSALEFRIKNLEGNSHQLYGQYDQNEIEDIKQLMQGILNDVQIMKDYIPPWFQIEISKYVLKDELTDLEKKLQKKVSSACDKLNDLVQNSIVSQQKITQPTYKDDSAYQMKPKIFKTNDSQLEVQQQAQREQQPIEQKKKSKSTKKQRSVSQKRSTSSSTKQKVDINKKQREVKELIRKHKKKQSNFANKA